MNVDAPALIASGAAALVVLLIAVLWRLLGRRALTRRLDSLTVRLGSSGSLEADSRGGLEASLSRLERAAAGAVADLQDAKQTGERASQSLELIGSGVVVCDRDGVVIIRNQRAAEFVGTRHGEALATEATERLIRRALAGGEGSETLELFGPPRRTLTIAAFPLHGDRGPLGAVAIIDDISERRRLDAVRRDFVANISHELKTPIGALGLLAETLHAEDDPKVVKRMAERMQNEAFRVGRIIEDLLDLSRIESEEHPEREPVAVHLLLNQAAERVRPLAEHRGIIFEGLDASRRLNVVGDRRQLAGALHSLLENAVNYSDDGVVVKIAVRHTGHGVEISVADTGIGIPARDLDRIFERFYRVDRSRGRDTGGTGLGLAIARHVATNHKGEILVSSREGEGSTFTFRLPAGPGPAVVSSEVS